MERVAPYPERLRDVPPTTAQPSASVLKEPDVPPPAEEEGTAQELAAPAPAVPPADRAPATPAEDPSFGKAREEVRAESRRQRKHAPKEQKRKEAADAAALTESEQIEQSSREKSAAEMERVGSAQQGAAARFSAEGFKQDLLKRVDSKKPRDEGEAKELARKPPLQDFEQEFSGKVAAEQDKVTGPLAQRARQAPSGGKVEKPVRGIPKPASPSAPLPVDPQLAAPKPRTPQEISLQHESDRLDDTMRENRLSEQQLADSREPGFIKALETKREAQQKVAEAPEVYRRKESALLEAAQVQAESSLSGGLQGMSAVQGRSRSQVFGGQQKTETATEKRQREIKRTIDDIYDRTVRDVKQILERMAAQVKDDFTRALKEGTDEFNSEVRRRISDYYGDWRIDDDLFGPDDVIVKEDGTTRAMTFEEKFRGDVKKINPDVYRIFVREKDKFTRAMDRQLDLIASNVQAGLTDAHNRIREGEAEISRFKATLTGEELAYADTLEEEVKLKFQALEASIDDAREDLLQTLSDQYSENVTQLEKTFNEINDELKKGWLERAAEFIKTVAKTIFDLANLLLTILVRMAHLIWDIVRHPIRFFETLVAGLMQGIRTFVGNIGTYLQEAFWTWVTGTTSARGIRLSSGSGTDSLFGIVLQVLGLTPADLRVSAEKVLGKEFMQLFDKSQHLAEKALEPVTILLTQGPGALWAHIKETLAETVQASFKRIRESVFNTFIEKALKWIAGFFVPGGGFVKIVKAVLRAFQFVAENLERIRHFFDAVFDSMEAAIQGKTGGVAEKVVAGLKMGIVMALDFLAKQIGLGAIVNAVQGIIQALRRPIVNAVEWLLGKIKPLALKLVAKVKEVAARAKAGVSKTVAKLFSWAGCNSRFKDADGESHTIYVDADGGRPRLMIASSPQAAGEFLKWYLEKQTDKDFQKDNADRITAVKNAIAASDAAASSVERTRIGGKATEKEMESLQRALLDRNVALSEALRLLIGDDRSVGRAREKYKLEGLTGTYGSMPKPPGDYLTADHQPQAAILEAAAELDYFADTGQMVKRAAARARLGYAINLYKVRHEEGRTFGRKGKITKDDFIKRVRGRIAPRMGRAAQRKVVIEEIRSDLIGPNGDVTAMKKVANQVAASLVWKDVMGLGGARKNKKENEALVEEIRKRILAGEDQIAAQDLDSLAD